MNEDWRKDAACKIMGFDLFFGGEDEPPATRISRELQAKEICKSCIVKQDCLEFAQETDCYGIWGGLTMVERRRLKLELEHEAYMKRRFSQWPQKLVVLEKAENEWQVLENRAGWKGDTVSISMRDCKVSMTGVEFGVFVDHKMAMLSKEESEAWLYFASLTIT